MTLIDII
jgi:hypothetical protein